MAIHCRAAKNSLRGTKLYLAWTRGSSTKTIETRIYIMTGKVLPLSILWINLTGKYTSAVFYISIKSMGITQ